MKTFTINWRYGGYAGDSLVTFELSEQGDDGTVLRLTHLVTASFPEDVPEFSRESGITGWKYFITESLPRS